MLLSIRAVQVPRWTSYSSIQPTGRPARWSSWTPGWAGQVRWTRPSSSAERFGVPRPRRWERPNRSDA
ncbi:hypothetical protein ACFQ0M_00495 [Kitasatospora aburaviensis]